MKKDIFDKLYEGKLDDLSAVERNDLDSIASSEQEIFVIQQLLQNAKKIKEEQHTHTQVKSSIKIQLDALLDQQNQSKQLWYNSTLLFLWDRDKNWINQHAIKIAAILCVLLTVIPFITWKTDKPIQLAKQENLEKDTQDKNNESKISSKESIEEKKENINSSEPVEKNTEKIELVTEPEVKSLEDERKGVALTSRAEKIDDTEKDVFSSAPAESTIVSPGSSHPDGIYADDTQSDSRTDKNFENQTFSMKNNKELFSYFRACY